MAFEITSKTEFMEKIENSNEPMIIVFYTNGNKDIADSQTRHINREVRKRHKNINIFRVNLTNVILSDSMLTKYKSNLNLVCCVSKSDEIKMRYTNPNQPQVKSLVRSIT